MIYYHRYYCQINCVRGKPLFTLCVPLPSRVVCEDGMPQVLCRCSTRGVQLALIRRRRENVIP
jgi:hypothetical protein